MRRPPRTTTSPAGFTLIEVLIVTVIIGLLAAVMIPAFLGQKDRAQGATAESLLRSGATTMESASVNTDGYTAITTAMLTSLEPSIHWLDASGATTPAGEVSVTDLGANGYTLTTTTGAGKTYTLVKDLMSAPTITRTCGPGCTW